MHEAQVIAEVHRASDGIAALNRVISHGGDTRVAVLALGGILQAQQDMQRAVEVYQAQLRRTPNDRQIMQALGAVGVHAGASWWSRWR